MVLGCAALFLYGLYRGLDRLRLVRKGVRVRARIVGWERSSNIEGSDLPIVELKDRSGKRHRVALASSEDGSGIQDGRKEILYWPADPTRASGTSFFELWLIPLVCMGAGLLGLVFTAMLAMGLIHLP